MVVASQATYLDTGTVESQYAAWGDVTAPSLARLSWSLLKAHTSALSMSRRGLSQTFWLVSAGSTPPGIVGLRASITSSMNASLHSSTSSTAPTSDLVDAADAR